MEIKNRYMAILLILAVIMLSACTTGDNSAATKANTAQIAASQNNAATNPDKNDEQTKTTMQTKPAASLESITMDKIYHYDRIKNFEYQIITNVSGAITSTNVTYTLSSDTVDGAAAWLTTTQMTTQGANVLTKIWTDKSTFACLKMSNVITFNGQDMETPAECPKTGPNAASSGTDKREMPELAYLGSESVTVPAGTYTAKKYSLNNTVTYFYSDSVPVPIKLVFGSDVNLNVSSTMELVSWN